MSAYVQRPTPEDRPAAVAGNRVVVARRPALDLPMVRPALANGTTGSAEPDDETEGESPLDVPAFLRRQEN
jgi:hypothetical protein